MSGYGSDLPIHIVIFGINCKSIAVINNPINVGSCQRTVSHPLIIVSMKRLFPCRSFISEIADLLNI